jgi:hypothetical protein
MATPGALISDGSHLELLDPLPGDLDKLRKDSGVSWVSE